MWRPRTSSPDYRPTAYTSVLTVSAMSDAGRVSGSGSFSVRVTESEGFFIGGWNVGGTAKAAVRALSAVAWAATTVIIWLGILSPGDTGGRWDCLSRKPPCPPQGSPTAGTRVLHQVWWKVG